MVALWLLACVPDDVTLNLVLLNLAPEGSIVASDATTHDVKLAPGLVVVHDATVSLFTSGEAASPELESAAEDGDPQAFIDALTGAEGVYAVALLTHEDEVTYEAAAMLPGQDGRRQITGPGDAVVSVAFMFGESNDIFYANAEPIPLWDKGANAGDWTSSIGLWDAGTEVNQEPGIGPDQAPHQEEAGQGTTENGVVTAVDGIDASGFTYPDVSAVVSLVAEAPATE